MRLPVEGDGGEIVVVNEVVLGREEYVVGHGQAVFELVGGKYSIRVSN